MRNRRLVRENKYSRFIHKAKENSKNEKVCGDFVTRNYLTIGRR